MKKQTKLCAAILAGALLLNSSAVVHADASFSVDITQFILNNLEAVDDPYGMCEHTLSSNKSAYKIFRCTDVNFAIFDVVYDPKYNFTEIQLLIQKSSMQFMKNTRMNWTLTNVK